MKISFYFYILECSDGTRYYGHTNNLQRRIVDHSKGYVLSTRNKRPVKLVYFEELDSCSEAFKRERQFKNGKTRKQTIEKLVKSFSKAKCQGFNSHLQRRDSNKMQLQKSSIFVTAVLIKKQVLRRRMKQKLISQKQSERRNKSKIIQKKLFTQKEFLTSKRVMLYVSKGTGEVETGPIIKRALKMGKSVVLPVTLVREKRIKPVYLKDLKEGFKKGSYGIYEPEEPSYRRPVRIKDIDLVIVPGLAFDKRNNRLGRGQGYYDNFLKRLTKKTPKIGLGFRFQLLKDIPATRNDTPLTKVITD